MYNLSAYLPDALVPQFEAIRDQLISWLELFGLAKSAVDGGAGTLCFEIVLSAFSDTLSRYVEDAKSTQ